MNHTVFVVIYLVIMGALIVGLDILFLRDLFWLRLAVNVGIVAVFVLLYLLAFKNAFT